jgi:hypothetical protein
MAKFSRCLRPEAILALEELSKSPHDNWWKELLRLWAPAGSPAGLRLAIRSNYVDFYRMGNRVAHVSFGQCKKGEAAPVSVKTHAKYVYGEDGGNQEIAARNTSNGWSWAAEAKPISFAQIADNIDGRMASLRNGTYPRKGLEKQGVDDILANNPAVIDLEMALPRDSTIGKPDDGAPRMDLVALERCGAEICIVFSEAKTFDDDRLRFEDVKEVEDDRKKKKTKNVLTQLETYSNYVVDKDRRQEIIVAYRETCRLLTWFWSMRGEQNPLHPLIEEAASGDSNLVIDRKPRLVIFSSEGGKGLEGDPYWKRHKDRIDKGGYQMIIKNSAAEISLPLWVAN